MFISLTDYDSGKKICVNFDRVRKFRHVDYKSHAEHGKIENGPGTVLDLDYGTMVVREGYDEILEIIDMKSGCK